MAEELELTLNFEFRGFLLQLGKELSSQNLEHLKFVLADYFSAQCEEMTFCTYFDELKKRCFLSPTNFGVLKKGLDKIGRQDLVDKIVQKEQYFAKFSIPSGAPNLGTYDFDTMSDGITDKRHSGKNSLDLQNELLKVSSSNEDAITIEEISAVLPDSDHHDKLSEQKKEKTKKTQADNSLKKEEDMDVSHDGSINLHNEQTTSDKAAKDEFMESHITEPGVTGVDKKSTFKKSPKEPCEDEILYCNDPEEFCSGKASNTGLPDGKLPSMSSNNLDSDVVTDGNQNGEESVAESKANGEKCGKKSPIDDPGARPKEKKAKTAGPCETANENAMEVDDKETNPHGTLHFASGSSEDYVLVPPEIKSSKEPTESGYSNPSSPVGTVHEEGSGSNLNFSDDSAVTSKKGPKVPLPGSAHGTHISMELPKDYPPTDGFSTPPSGFGTPMSTCHSHDKRPLLSDEEEPYESEPASMGLPKFHHPPGVFSTPPPSVYKGSMNSDHAYPGFSNLSGEELMGIAAAIGLDFSAQQHPPKLNHQQQMALLQQLLACQESLSGPKGFTNPGQRPPVPNSQTPPSTDLTVGVDYYCKEGYSVAVTKGHLIESTADKGLVLMESGTQFCIVVGNDNDHAAEVDITFGGMYLGVWALEAKQSISHNPLVIEGSSWAKGRLTFFSLADENKPKPNADYYDENQDLHGLIELEFKPEVYMLKMFAQHVRDQRKDEGLIPVSIAFSCTTTVGDLKQEISRKWDSRISCLLKGGQLLEEGKTISSYALNKNEVIRVVNTAEELKIESVGKDPIIMIVDPRNISLDDVKHFIAKHIKIQPDEQLLRFKGQDVDPDSKTLTHALLTSKKTPELKVFKDRDINIEIIRPDGRQERVIINWFATVQELKDVLEDRGICDSSDTLKLYENNKDISGVGNRKLVDLSWRNTFKIIVSETTRSTHRGFNMSSLSGGSRRGFGMNLQAFDGLVKPTAAKCLGRMRGFPDSAGTRAGAGGSTTSEAAYGYLGDDGEAGVAMLCGDEENVSKNFQVDNSELKFSKEKAVTLTILLKAKSMGATGGATCSQPYFPLGACSGATGPKSTPCPPPVPD
ncbi:uncharacterized protein LOC111340652 isoform X2 [Stylophora pistillata]|uniref:uncharacterized protein LOC111340652 isoform X2 n=1 Tax=Stylophora pistillata TaxID=50429 RepID=UPI000C04AF79|nr:uncharacterized protein LOC111340652 isoform X2 [Stylophora pistillata]